MEEDATGIAEDIVEFFNGQEVDKILNIWGSKAGKALKLLEDMGLVRIENDKIVLTSSGEEFLELPVG